MIDIEKVLKEKGRLIEDELEKVFSGKDIPNLYDAIQYHMGTGGKRLRPVLAIVTCEALGGDSKKVIPFAAACELLHNWLLIHDDIEDGDRIRRNKPALWVKYGLAHGVNAGDLMSQKVYELILDSRNYGVDDATTFRLIQAMVDTAVRTAEGQAMDINLRNENNPTEEKYMKMIKGKTAYYLTVPMVGGAIIAGASETVIKKIIKFGEYAGPAFQIADDLLDLTEGKGRGEIGSDIKEGKRSILVTHCISKCGEEEKERLIEILNKPRDETTKEDILWVKSLFEKYGSLEYARKKGEDLIQKAKSVAAELPPEAGNILSFFADFIIKRKH
jgi:geranylgeranyl pyrophosphate synthase